MKGRKKMIEIKKGVFRDPDMILIAASNGKFIQWSEKE